MLDYLWLIPALPFAGFIILAVIGARIPRPVAAAIGAGSVGISALVALGIATLPSCTAPPQGHVYTQLLWGWISVGGFKPDIALTIDALSLIMVLVITGVGFMIHLYSTESMAGEKEGYSRFFAYMNLFVGSMLTLVLADNLLLLYLGWEGVGLCSYLLIGFWYKDPANGRAAMKAFIVTRVGDASMAIGLFILYHNLGTLQIHEVLVRAAQQWPAGSTLAIAAAALLLGGAVGKSAQLPLQTWLPDAMAGPTPVSALIHAATMVTAGVYLIARTHVLFTIAPQVQLAVAVIGAATLLLAGISALTQWDIKRALAYSTMSQIGYMFLALGVGAWSAAIFHFMVHAFFKALLFLSAGVVIDALHHERDMFKMGGLRLQLPLAFWCFLIGAASLSALPLITAGFYSKDLILWETWTSASGQPMALGSRFGRRTAHFDICIPHGISHILRKAAFGGTSSDSGSFRPSDQDTFDNACCSVADRRVRPVARNTGKPAALFGIHHDRASCNSRHVKHIFRRNHAVSFGVRISLRRIHCIYILPLQSTLCPKLRGETLRICFALLPLRRMELRPPVRRSLRPTVRAGRTGQQA